jgi:hypothetical protein
VDVNTTNDAAIAFYGHIKMACQIASYIGLAVSAGLGTFDLFYKEQHEKINGKARSTLNPAGRTHLALFITVSLLTVLSTVGKDLAASKLDSMSMMKAQAELRQALGGDIRNITKDALTPAVTELAKSISTQTTALSTNIARSESTLNGAVKRSGAAMQELVVENSKEAAAANMPVGKFEVIAILPLSMMPHVRSTKRLSRWTHIFDARCGPDTLVETDSHVCSEMEVQIGQLDIFQDFIAIIDPTDSSEVAFSFVMRSFAIDVKVAADCDPFTPDGRSPHDLECVQFSDFHTRVNSFGVSNVHVFPPGISASETGPRTDAGSTPLTNVFGRDLEFELLEITVKSPNSLERLPDEIGIDQRLIPLGSSEDKVVDRRYTVRINRRFTSYSKSLGKRKLYDRE